jgi:hypothetical protein
MEKDRHVHISMIVEILKEEYSIGWYYYWTHAVYLNSSNSGLRFFWNRQWSSGFYDKRKLFTFWKIVSISKKNLFHGAGYFAFIVLMILYFEWYMLLADCDTRDVRTYYKAIINIITVSLLDFPTAFISLAFNLFPGLIMKHMQFKTSHAVCDIDFYSTGHDLIWEAGMTFIFPVWFDPINR